MKKYQDYYFHKAKAENYPARSVYKLKEADRQYKIFAPGQKVLDLGASPGSWSLYAAERVGERGTVIGVDLNPPNTAFPPQVFFYVSDVFSPAEELKERLEVLRPFNVIVSDMAPKTTGIKFADQARSMELAEQAYSLCSKLLIKGGSFVVKIFFGPDLKAYTLELKKAFREVKIFKPLSSRSESKEVFVLGLSFKGGISAETAG